MKRPAWARWVTRISLVLGLVALVFTIKSLGMATIGRQFRLIGWWWSLVIAFEIAITTLDAVAIRSFASPDRVSLKTALLAQLAGRSVNAVTPGGNLGEPVKISVLTDSVDNSRAVSTILLYNIVSFTVELLLVAIAAPIMALVLADLSGSMRLAFVVAGSIALVISIGLYALVRRGMLASVARLGVRLHLLSPARFARWQTRLAAVDDKLRLTAGARRGDRVAGIAAVIVSRALSTGLSLVLLVAVGEHIGLGFITAYTVGGFAIYMASSLVPMGLGIAEGGYYELFTALHERPSLGVVLVLSRRCVLVGYAAIGFVLVAMSESVRRAREAPASPPDGAPVTVAAAVTDA